MPSPQSAVRQPVTEQGFFDTPLAAADPEIFDAVRREVGRHPQQLPVRGTFFSLFVAHLSRATNPIEITK